MLCLQISKALSEQGFKNIEESGSVTGSKRVRKGDTYSKVIKIPVTFNVFVDVHYDSATE